MTSPAAAHLRASIAALPEPIRQRWLSFSDQVYVEHNGNDHVFAWTDTNRTTSPAGNAETADLIATVASPDVVVLWADLLDVLARVSLLTVVDEHDNEISMDLLETHRALEAAILRSAT